MIHSFLCKNFYSFKEESVLDFTVNNKAPKNNGYCESFFGDRVSKVETVVGANASGKTNLLKVLPFLKWLIVDSFNIQPDASILVQPFLFGGSKNKPTELSVVFEMSGKIYSYSFLVDKDRILREELKLTYFKQENRSTKKLFLRLWDNKNNAYSFKSAFKLPKEFKKYLRTNASVLAVAARFNHLESQEIINYWKNVETNVVEAGWVGDRLLPNSLMQLYETFDFFSSNMDLKEQAEKILQRFDLGLESFEIEKKKQDKGFSFEVKTFHLFDGEKQQLSMHYESSGTKQLMILLKNILAALKNGSIAVIDEFECNLHPEMVLALYDLFVQKETNPNNAQLLMSTHSHTILNKLDKYQIILVEKNENGFSETWRLDDVSGLRADDNYYAKYISGAYGAFPKI